jgi:anti-sigma-K factor RskA
LEPLRPDDIRHARIKRRVHEQADTLLRARRSAAGWQSVAARWALLLAPVAAALAVAFAGLAYRAGPGEPPSTEVATLTVEQLVAEGRDDVFPALLTSATEPSKDHLLAAAMAGRAPQP